MYVFPVCLQEEPGKQHGARLEDSNQNYEEKGKSQQKTTIKGRLSAQGLGVGALRCKGSTSPGRYTAFQSTRIAKAASVRPLCQMVPVPFIVERGEDKQSTPEVRAACAGTSLFPVASLGGDMCLHRAWHKCHQMPDHRGSPQLSIREGEKSFGLG